MPPALRVEIEIEIARLALVKQQIKALGDAQRVEVEAGGRPIVSQLMRLRAISVKSGWGLDKEMFGWRRALELPRRAQAAPGDRGHRPFA